MNNNANIAEDLNKNIEEAAKLIDTKKKEIKNEKELKLKTETRMEENQKGLEKDYQDVRDMGFEPEKIDETLAEMDETLGEYNNKIQELIEKLKNFGTNTNNA